VGDVQEELVDALGAVDGEEGAHVFETSVLEDARQHRVGLQIGIDGVKVDVPEEPAHAPREGAHHAVPDVLGQVSICLRRRYSDATPWNRSTAPVASPLLSVGAKIGERPPMEPTDVTIEILKDIRTELHDGLKSVRTELHDDLKSVREELRVGLDGVRDEVQGVSSRLDRLERRQTEAEVRVATELVAIGGVMREVRDAFLEERALRARVDDHERRLTAIEKQAQ
jgi:hypothetical protein